MELLKQWYARRSRFVGVSSSPEPFDGVAWCVLLTWGAEWMAKWPFPLECRRYRVGSFAKSIRPPLPAVAEFFSLTIRRAISAVRAIRCGLLRRWRLRTKRTIPLRPGIFRGRLGGSAGARRWLCCLTGIRMRHSMCRCARGLRSSRFRRCGSVCRITIGGCLVNWTRADYAVSANVARTIDATLQQSVIDVAVSLRLAAAAGVYEDLGIVGTSLGIVLRISDQRARRTHSRERV